MEFFRWTSFGLSVAILVNSFTTAVLATKILQDSDPEFIDGWDKLRVAAYWISTFQSIVLILGSIFATGSLKSIFHNMLGFPIIGLSAISSIITATYLFKEIGDVTDYPGGANFYVVWYVVTYILTIILSFTQTTVYALFTLKARQGYDTVGESSQTYSNLK